MDQHITCSWNGRLGRDYPVMCADYAMKYCLLHTPGWTRFNRYDKNQKMFQRMINQAKMESFRRELFWKFGVLVPRTHAQAAQINPNNNNTVWQDAEATEMRQM
jgi:hypothetical protein